MEFNRLDICDAYYIFASIWHGGQFSKEYHIFGRLEKIKYKPASSLSEETLSENAKAIYDKLVVDLSFYQDYEPCGLCGATK